MAELPLSEELKSRFWPDVKVSPFSAFKRAGSSGTLLSLNANWLCVKNSGKISVEMADFSFLVVDHGTPLSVAISYENGKFGKPVMEDLTPELGELVEEEKLFSSIHLAKDDEILQLLERVQDLKPFIHHYPNLKLKELTLDPFFEETSAPAWMVKLSNLNIAGKGEEGMEIEVVVDALNRRLLRIAQII